METLTRTATTGSIELAVRRSGPDSEKPVVLVHGMGGDHHTWRPLARALRTAGRTVISYDQRGHGRSSRSPSYLLNDFRDDLSFVLDGLGVEQVDVVGHSLGGQTAMRMAMTSPERVGKLVLEEIPPMPRTQADLDENIAPFTGIADRVRGAWTMARYPGPVLRFDHRMSDVVTRQFDAIDTSWWDTLSLITFPTLIISGGERSFLPPRHLQSLTEALPRGDYFQIDAGHSVHRDRPDEFNRRVLDFLRL
ncbi:alpha/beta fold hydrolase [Williamsia limnetica]|uniref:alpha/beta fold hydrolase n=1 Tax=Williamsia limnetica TaxID=882452 RepID=UPI000D7D0ABD|nr:alpha/beta hydrolase [Williamsia limnetica]